MAYLGILLLASIVLVAIFVLLTEASATTKGVVVLVLAAALVLPLSYPHLKIPGVVVQALLCVGILVYLKLEGLLG